MPLHELERSCLSPVKPLEIVPIIQWDSLGGFSWGILLGDSLGGFSWGIFSGDFLGGLWGAC
ncbi:MAG: hypothetical protein AB1486_25400, partial [Planctomycetota bacterium]